MATKYTRYLLLSRSVPKILQQNITSNNSYSIDSLLCHIIIIIIITSNGSSSYNSTFVHNFRMFVNTRLIKHEDHICNGKNFKEIPTK